MKSWSKLSAIVTEIVNFNWKKINHGDLEKNKCIASSIYSFNAYCATGVKKKINQFLNRFSFSPG